MRICLPRLTPTEEQRTRARRLGEGSGVKVSPMAGKPAPESILANIPRLMTAYYACEPDSAVAAQRVAFGASGHRGTYLE